MNYVRFNLKLYDPDEALNRNLKKEAVLIQIKTVAAEDSILLTLKIREISQPQNAVSIITAYEMRAGGQKKD